MRVILINPPHPYLIKPDSQAPLGLLYVAAALREWGRAVDVDLVNLSSVPPAECLERIPGGADFYGFTATCIDYQACERLAQELREREEHPWLVIGGPAATVSPEIVSDVFDSLCIGEGEHAIFDMLHDATVQGHLWPVYQRPRADLEALPYPARDLMDTIGGDIFARGEHYFGGKSTVIAGSRGCPYDCSFCAARPVWHGKVTYREVGSIADEMRHCIDEYGIREFRFSDDALNLRPKRLRELCALIEPLDVAWRCSVRAGLSSLDDFEAMAAAGCKEVSPGIESWDQRVLDHLHKQTSVRQNRELCEWATAAGLNVRVLMMSGTPGEHPDTPEINREALEEVPFEAVSLTQFRPIPGSAIWQHPEQFGCRILSRDVNRYNFYFWQRGPDGERVETPIESVIETDLLGKSALERNMRRMRDYVLETGRCNQG